MGASSSGTATINIDPMERYYIKQINITAGANTTVETDGVVLDGNATEQTQSFDVESVFGDLLSATKSVEITGNNAGASAENLTIEIIGYIL